MQFLRFMLAVSVALTGTGAVTAPAPRHPTKPALAVRRIAGGHLFGRTEAEPEPASAFALCRGVRTWRGERVAVGDAHGRLVAGRDLVNLAAPFAIAAVDDGGRLSVATDHVGLGHVYAARGAGWAAVSSSARELARLSGAPLDHEAMGVFRLVGHHLGTLTPYRGITKIPPGSIWRVADGELTVEPYPGPAAEPVPLATGAAVRRHGELLRAAVGGFLDTHPGTVIELSGGLDSRTVLAAIPPERRGEVRALTLGHPGSTDIAVAAGLAQRYGMPHQIIDLTAMADVEPAEAYRAAIAAAERLDGLGSPLGAAALDWVERQVGGDPRLGGHGGELARGAYYMQRQHPRVEPGLVDRLAAWWVTANHAVPDEVLEPAFAAHSRATTRQRLRETFAGYRTDWLTATDEFYLRERLHRWAGLTLTDAASHRVVANPLLDPEVLTVIRGVPREQRSGSRYAARVLDWLDADLARLPLGSGLRPISLSRQVTLSRQLGENTVRGFAQKAVNKVGRRFGRPANPAVGTAALAAAVTAHLRRHPDLLAPAVGTGLVNVAWVDDYLSGRADASPPTVDLLLNLVVATAP
ncbi:asparagine synthase-related protein [Actinomycetes bacterium KLBMP 9797]